MKSAPTLRILGVDPGTLRLGFGLIEIQGRTTRLLGSGVLSAPASWETARRLGYLSTELAQLIDGDRPACIALEASFFGKNARSLIRMAEARGMVLALAGSRGIEVCDYPPATVKKAVTGNGGASKLQIARVLAALMPELGRASDVERLDRTDALAVAWCHARELERKARRAAVDRVLEANDQRRAG